MLPIGKQHSFAERMGSANRPARSSGEGVVADWSQLPAETKAARRGWALVGSGISPMTDHGGGGRAEWNYAWKEDKDRTLSIHVFVFNGGQPAAIEKMDRVGNGSNMPVNPFGPAPDVMRLGDWTAVPYPAQTAKLERTHDVFWVYRNVFAEVEMDGEDADTLPIARAIQRFMEKHKVDDLATYLPKVSELRIEPERVSVGESFRVKVIGSPNTNLKVSIGVVQGEVRYRATNGRSSTWEGREPGRAVLEAVVLNKKTLFLATTRASVEVVPVNQ